MWKTNAFKRAPEPLLKRLVAEADTSAKQMSPARKSPQ
jgi:hypothetical protein